MKVKTTSRNKPITICRINKASADKLIAKQYYYYIYKEKDKPDEIVFIDNSKGKAVQTQFNTVEELEKFAKSLIKDKNK